MKQEMRAGTVWLCVLFSASAVGIAGGSYWVATRNLPKETTPAEEDQPSISLMRSRATFLESRQSIAEANKKAAALGENVKDAAVPLTTEEAAELAELRRRIAVYDVDHPSK